MKYTRLRDVGGRTTNAIPLLDLVEMQLVMLVNSNCDDPQAHCAAQGDAVGDVGQLRLQCLLATHQDVRARKVALDSFTPRARGYLTQHSAVRWGTAPRVRAKLGTPWWKNPGDG